MSQSWNLYEAKAHLSELVERAAAGEEIILAKSGKPMAKLVPLHIVKRKRKPAGALKITRIAKDFDSPLSAECLATFGIEP